MKLKQAALLVLEVHNPSKTFQVGRDRIQVLCGADFTFRHGQILGLAEESGNGKSTLAWTAIRRPAVVTCCWKGGA